MNEQPAPPKKIIRLIAFTSCALILIGVQAGLAQQSDAKALEVVKQAVTKMGGESAWSSVTAASSTATIAMLGVQSREVTWSDDWREGNFRYRREATNSDGQKAVSVEANGISQHQVGTGAKRSYPSVNGLAVLSEDYPAAALVSSLHRPNCKFKTVELEQETESSGDLPVAETCSEDKQSNRTVSIRWVFSGQSGLPKSVRVPVMEVISGQSFNKTVTFTSFQTSGGLLVPEQVRVTDPAGNIKSLQVTNVTLTTSLPDSLFTISK